MDPPPAAPPSARVSRWFDAVLIVAFAGLAARLALTTSATPVVLGRYSTPWFAVQCLDLAALACLVISRLRGVGYALVVVATFLAPSNESVRQWDGVLALLPAVRLLTAGAVVAAEFDGFRASRRVRGAALGAGFALGALALLDLALWTWVAATSGFDEDYEGYRDRYALQAVTPDDVVVVGDSFVWGHGVRKDDRFGNVLERLYAADGRKRRVYSLGVRGAGPDRYLESLARIPAGRTAGAVVVAFYPNDLAPRPKPRVRGFKRLENATWALGRSSLTCRALHDALGRVEASTLERYHESVVADFDPADPTFPARWKELTDALGLLADLARARSRSKPVLLIIPLMVDFGGYPLSAGHDRLRAAAEALGYDVVDLLPEFRAALGDGSKYRVRPGDNHFDARVHALVAATLKRRLDRP